MPRKISPLIKALIDMLPEPGSSWTEAQQLSWLKLMAHALSSMYGGDVGPLLGQPPSAKLERWPPAPAASPPTSPPKRSAPPRARWVIDKDGLAWDTKKSKRINKDDVPDGEFITDERGMDGDMATIVWSDGSTGIRGLSSNVAITASTF